MKFVFVAPEISSPYTEGRKRFVRDLVAKLIHEHQVFLLTTKKPGAYTAIDSPFSSTVHGHSALHLWQIIRQLPKILRNEKPDIVCLFPYGTFRHIYGVVNKSFIWLINKICQLFQIPCLTIMYSMDEYIHLEQLKKYAMNVAVTGHFSASDWVIDIGLPCFEDFKLERVAGCKKILFMAGMWEPNLKRVEHVIDTRGLEHLLKIGNILAQHEIELIIAAPLFSSHGCQEYLIQHPLNTWPNGSITFYSEVKVPEIFAQCDIFVFPYQKHIKQFVPTSVLESMCAGRCVALSDIPLFDALTNLGKTAYLLSLDNSEQMAEVLIDAMASPENRREKEIAAKQLIHDEWSIEKSVSQVLTISKKILNLP